MTWLTITVLVSLAFVAGLGVCYWKRCSVIPTLVRLTPWTRPRKEPVDAVAARLDEAVDRLEAVHAELACTVRTLQTGAPVRDSHASPLRRT